MAYYMMVQRGGLGSVGDPDPGLGLTIPLPGIQVPGAGDPCDPKSINWDPQLCSQEVSAALPSTTTMLLIGGIGLLAAILLLRR